MEIKIDKLIKGVLQASAALISSIISNIICDALSFSHFELLTVEGKTTIVEISNFSTIERILITLISFSSLWFLIGFVLPTIFSFVKSRKLKKKKKHNKKSILANYEQIKCEVKTHLYEQLTLNFSHETRTLYSGDIARWINELHLLFYPSNNWQKKVIHSSFRSGTTVNDAGKYISPYEFDCLLRTIERLLDSIFKEADDKLMQNDYAKLKEKLQTLKKVGRDKYFTVS